MSTAKTPNPTVKLYGRLSFPSLFTPKVNQEDATKKPKYEATIIMNKKTEAPYIKALQTAIDEVKKSPTLKGKKPAKVCLRPGDDTDARAELEGYGPDVMTCTARNHRKPAVVDRDLTPLAEDDARLFAGCYVFATVEVYPFVHPKSGALVCASLRGVQYVKKGEPFGDGPINAEKEFDALPQEEEDAVM